MKNIEETLMEFESFEELEILLNQSNESDLRLMGIHEKIFEEEFGEDYDMSN